MKQKFLSMLVFSLLALQSITLVYAQSRISDGNTLLAGTGPTFFEPSGETNFDQGRYSLENIANNLLPSVATYLGGFIAAVAVVFLVWAGVQFLTAGGDEEKIGKAAKTAFYIIGALVLMSFAYALVALFLSLFNPSA